MLHFIWVFTVCQSTCLPISKMKRDNMVNHNPQQRKFCFCLYWCFTSQSTIFHSCQDYFLSCLVEPVLSTVKPVYNCHSKINKTKVLMTTGSLMKIEIIDEWSILQYFWPALSDNWSWKPFFLSFLEWLFYTGLLYAWNYFSQKTWKKV